MSKRYGDEEIKMQYGVRGRSRETVAWVQLDRHGCHIREDGRLQLL